MKTLKYLLAVPLLVGLSAPAMAHKGDGHGRHHHDRSIEWLESRMEKQHMRIRKGVRKGQLTHREARKLRKMQRRIARTANDMLDDGYLDRHEKRHLKKRLNRASKRIYRLKHNDRYRHYDRHERRYGFLDRYGY